MYNIKNIKMYKYIKNINHIVEGPKKFTSTMFNINLNFTKI